MTTEEKNTSSYVSGFQLSDSCPVYMSEDWQAKMVDTISFGKYRHIVSGVVTVPSPGYTFELEELFSDRRAPPGLYLRLNIMPPELPMSELLTDEHLEFELALPHKEYRTIKIRCGGNHVFEVSGSSLVYMQKR